MDAFTWPPLDPATLLFSVAVLAFSVAGVTLSTARAVDGGRFGLVLWCQAMAATGLAVLLYFFRGHGPLLATYVGANACVLAVPSFAYLAYARFYALRPQRYAVGALYAVGLAGVIGVHWLGWPYVISVVTVCGAMAALFGMSAWMVLRYEGRSATLPAVLSAAAIGILTLAFAVRASLAALQSNDTPVDRAGSVVFLLVSSSIFVGIASLAFVLMVQERYRRESLESSRRDCLTGLLTRAAFFESAAELDRAGAPYGLVVIDVDHFKAVNDTRGHACGDAVLAHVGRLVQRSVRTADLAGRYGGEEFCVILRGCGEEETRRFAERLVADAASQTVRLVDSDDTLQLTVSAGFAVKCTGTSREALADAVEQVFKRADEALYEAKRGGRNRARAAAARMDVVAKPSLEHAPSR